MKCLGITALINFNDWNNPNYAETGGVNSVIKNILPYLDAEKIILYGITYQKEKLFKEEKLNDRVSVFAVIYKSPFSRLPNRILGFMYGWRLKKYFHVHQVNFVYSHSEELAFWLPATKVFYIHHLHTYVNALEVSGGRLARIKLLQRIWDQIRRRSIVNSKKSVAINNDIFTMLKSLIGENRVIRFSNFVDQNRFQYCDPCTMRAKLNLNLRKVVLFVGRISKVKGMELFVDIVGQLIELDRESNWCGIVIGNGEYEDILKDYIETRQLKHAFVLVGSTNSSDTLCEYYSLADVFLITSFSESVPLTLLESLVCGTPVVSTNVGICSNVLGYQNGYVVESGSANEMATKVLASLSLKKMSSILSNSHKYSVEYASSLLNKEFWK
jgi:glycosyltransferase involved in cell wall biosynthesis